jgi:hypothetical protein
MQEEPPPPPSDPPPPFRLSRLRKYRPLLRAKAQALIERGEIVIETNGRPLRARILWFSDGTGVLEYDYRSPHGSSHGKTRLEPPHLDAEILAQYLETAFRNARVRPVAGQEI